LVGIDATTGLLDSWTFAPSNPTSKITQVAMPLGMNLWCYENPPSDGKEVELIVRDFQFVPLGASLDGGTEPADASAGVDGRDGPAAVDASAGRDGPIGAADAPRGGAGGTVVTSGGTPAGGSSGGAGSTASASRTSSASGGAIGGAPATRSTMTDNVGAGGTQGTAGTLATGGSSNGAGGQAGTTEISGAAGGSPTGSRSASSKTGDSGCSCALARTRPTRLGLSILFFENIDLQREPQEFLRSVLPL
jgi:hypothetical protein